MCVFFLFLIIRALITFSLDLSVSLSPSISLRSCVVSPSLLRVFIPTHTQTHTLSLYILFSAISLSKALAQIRTSRRWLSSKGIKVHTARTTPTQFSFSLSLYLKEKELYFGVLFFFCIFARNWELRVGGKGGILDPVLGFGFVRGKCV